MKWNNSNKQIIQLNMNQENSSMHDSYVLSCEGYLLTQIVVLNFLQVGDIGCKDVNKGPSQQLNQTNQRSKWRVKLKGEEKNNCRNLQIGGGFIETTNTSKPKRRKVEGDQDIIAECSNRQSFGISKSKIRDRWIGGLLKRVKIVGFDQMYIVKWA